MSEVDSTCRGGGGGSRPIPLGRSSGQFACAQLKVSMTKHLPLCEKIQCIALLSSSKAGNLFGEAGSKPPAHIPYAGYTSCTLYFTQIYHGIIIP